MLPTMLHLTDWLVIAGGLAAIGWVWWYFFLAQSGASSDQLR